MKKLDVLLLVMWAVIPPIVVLYLQANFITSIFLYLVLPSIYFSLKKPGIIPRAAIVSFTAMLMGAILDYIAFLNHTWVVPTLFSFKILQLVPLEDFLFVFFAAYVIISGFHYFFPEFNLSRIRTGRLKKASGIVLGVFVAFLLVSHYYPQVLLISYYDAWLLAIAFIFPSIILLIRHPEYSKPLLWVVLFQLVAMLPYELTADALGFWTFPSSDYLGMIHLLGQKFPVEEFLEWMICMAPAVLSFNIFMVGSSQVESKVVTTSSSLISSRAVGAGRP
jgi:hypothetical protein